MEDLNHRGLLAGLTQLLNNLFKKRGGEPRTTPITQDGLAVRGGRWRDYIQVQNKGPNVIYYNFGGPASPANSFSIQPNGGTSYENGWWTPQGDLYLYGVAANITNAGQAAGAVVMEG